MLRALRDESCVTLDGAAATLECTRQKVWRIERGLGAVRTPDVKALCELYDASPELTAALTALATETKAKGWWHAYGDVIPEWFELYVGLESAASQLRFYADALMPGILPSRSYAEGIYRLDQPGMDAEEMARLVAVRLRRQKLLTRRLPSPPQLAFILSEAVLLRAVGDPATMAEQLRHLLKAARLPDVSLRVLPLTAGQHGGAVAGSFVLRDFPPGHRATPEPPIVYCESLTGALYLDRPGELAAYERVWSGLTARELDEGQSRQLMNKIIGEVHHG